MKKIFEGEQLPVNIEELAKKIREIYLDSDNLIPFDSLLEEDKEDYRRIAVFVAPHLVVGPDFFKNLIDKLRVIHPPTHKHQCHDWDGLEIDEYDPEFGACTCDFQHLTTRLNPGDECLGMTSRGMKYVNIFFYTGGVTRDGKIVLEKKDGSLVSVSGCEPLLKKKTYVKKFSEIVRMVEDGEYGTFSLQSGIIGNMNYYGFQQLTEICDKPYSYREEFDLPKEWLEKR